LHKSVSSILCCMLSTVACEGIEHNMPSRQRVEMKMVNERDRHTTSTSPLINAAPIPPSRSLIAFSS